MKKKLGLALILVMILVITTGCVSQGNFDELQTQYSELNMEYQKLKDEYNSLVIDTANWLKMTEEEKSAELAQAESDQLTTEKAAEAALKAKAEAEEKAETERRVAEERIRQESVSLKDIFIDPERFDGQFVRITDTLRLYDNDLPTKEYRAYIPTGKDYFSVNTDYPLYIFYGDMEDYKTWASLSKTDDHMITVAGTIKIRNVFGHISIVLQATEITLDSSKTRSFY